MHRFKDSVFADIIYQLTKTGVKKSWLNGVSAVQTHVAQNFPNFNF